MTREYPEIETQRIVITQKTATPNMHQIALVPPYSSQLAVEDVPEN